MLDRDLAMLEVELTPSIELLMGVPSGSARVGRLQ
jgi:hypothetical protein